jgi:protein gp37
MGESFGPWVPNEWIDAQIRLVEKYPQYIFQFLTKNPKRYGGFSFPKNCWLGTTWDGLPLTKQNIDLLCDWVPKSNITFVSFEPLLAPYHGELPVDAIDWIIIGELTGKAITQEEIHQVSQWAKELIDQAEALNIPVFVKNALGAIYPQREFPQVSMEGEK